MKHGLPKDTLLNINVPDLPEEELRGIRITRQGLARWQETFDKRSDPRGSIYYWMDGYKLDMEEPDDSDGRALSEGFITVTPIRLNMTNHDFIDDLRTWSIEALGAARAHRC